MTAAGSPVATLIYDGECAMCRASPHRARFPHVSDEQCMTAMQLVLPDGRVLAGADAVPELFARIPHWRWVPALFALPGIRPVARRVYAWIARNRMRISCAAGR